VRLEKLADEVRFHRIGGFGDWNEVDSLVGRSVLRVIAGLCGPRARRMASPRENSGWTRPPVPPKKLDHRCEDGSGACRRISRRSVLLALASTLPSSRDSSLTPTGTIPESSQVAPQPSGFIETDAASCDGNHSWITGATEPLAHCTPMAMSQPRTFVVAAREVDAAIAFRRGPSDCFHPLKRDMTNLCNPLCLSSSNISNPFLFVCCARSQVDCADHVDRYAGVP